MCWATYADTVLISAGEKSVPKGGIPWPPSSTFWATM